MSSRTATTARGSRSERSRLLRSRGGPDVQDDLSDHVARTEALVRLCRLIEREGRADGDLQPEALDGRSEEHTSELQSLTNLVCRLLLEKKKNNHMSHHDTISISQHDTGLEK